MGDGPTCLVLHGGLGVDHTYLRPGLGPLADGLRLVYLDHRGHGRSGRPPLGTLTVEQLAADAASVAIDVATGPVIVLGHDTGGFVAQELAVRHPDRVAGVVLVATSPGEPGNDEPLAEAWGPPPPVEVEVLQRVPPASDAEWEATVRAIAPFLVHQADPSAVEAVYSQTTFSAEAAVRMMQVLSGWSAVDRLASVKAPGLLVAGGHDVLRPPQQSERLARRLPDAELVVLEDSGHLPWLDEPDAFLTAVGKWCRRIAGSPTRGGQER